jgi:hypothetical protein
MLNNEDGGDATMADVVERTGITWPEILKAFLPVVEFVALAMEIGISHNDPHLGNMLLGRKDAKPHITVIDFGQATHMPGKAQWGHTPRRFWLDVFQVQTSLDDVLILLRKLRYKGMPCPHAQCSFDCRALPVASHG